MEFILREISDNARMRRTVARDRLGVTRGGRVGCSSATLLRAGPQHTSSVMSPDNRGRSAARRSDVVRDLIRRFSC